MGFGFWEGIIPAVETGRELDPFVGGHEVVAQVAEIRTAELAADVTWTTECAPGAAGAAPTIERQRVKKKRPSNPAPCAESHRAVMRVPPYLLPDENAANQGNRLRVGATVPIVLSQVDPALAVPRQRMQHAILWKLGPLRVEGGDFGVGLVFVVLGVFFTVVLSRLRAR